MTQIIMARNFIGALVDAGIVPHGTWRVVIDAKIDDPVLMLTEQWGSPELLRIGLTLEGIEVGVVKAEATNGEGP